MGRLSLSISMQVKIMLKLKISTLDISFNCIVTALKLSLPVKHEMFSLADKIKVSIGNTTEIKINEIVILSLSMISTREAGPGSQFLYKEAVRVFILHPKNWVPSLCSWP